MRELFNTSENHFQVPKKQMVRCKQDRAEILAISVLRLSDIGRVSKGEEKNITACQIFFFVKLNPILTVR